MKRLDISIAGQSSFIGVPDFHKYIKNNPSSEDRTGIMYGTAFLTDKKKIVTARHVVQPWRYYQTINDDYRIKLFWQKINAIETNGGIVEATFDIITSNGKWSEQITFRSGNISHDNDVFMDNVSFGSLDEPSYIRISDLFPFDLTKEVRYLPNKTKIAESPKSDWVSLDFNIKGSISLDRELSQKLKAGQTLHVLGYSHADGVMDYSKWAGSSYSKTTVANDATLNNVIYVSGLTFGPGNSGGPAFICQDGKLVCIGLVINSVGNSNAFIVPVSQIRGN